MNTRGSSDAGSYAVWGDLRRKWKKNSHGMMPAGWDDACVIPPLSLSSPKSVVVVFVC